MSDMEKIPDKHDEEYNLVAADFDISPSSERRPTMQNLGKVSLGEVNSERKLDKGTKEKIWEALAHTKGTEERARKKEFLTGLCRFSDEDAESMLNRPLTEEEQSLLSDVNLMKQYRDKQIEEKKKQEQQKQREALGRQIDNYFSSGGFRHSIDTRRRGFEEEKRVLEEFKRAFEENEKKISDNYEILKAAEDKINEYRDRLTNKGKAPVMTEESTGESPSKDSPKKGFPGLFRKKK